jgi:hypothetical protein
LYGIRQAIRLPANQVLRRRIGHLLTRHVFRHNVVRDPSNARTLDAVFSLVPYAEVWRTALEGSNLLARANPVSLVGSLAFLLLLMIAGGLLVRWLARQRGGAPLERGSPS